MGRILGTKLAMAAVGAALALALAPTAQAYELDWAVGIEEQGRVALDGDDAAIVVSSFELDYGDMGLTIGKFTLPDGLPNWETSITPEQYSTSPPLYHRGVAKLAEHTVDATGNVVVSGHYSGWLLVAPDDPNETRLGEGSWSDAIFTARYSPDGALLWAGDTGTGSGKYAPAATLGAVEVKAGGDIMMAGEFYGEWYAWMTLGVDGQRQIGIQGPNNCSAFPDGAVVQGSFLGGYGEDGGALWLVSPGSPVDNDECNGQSYLRDMAVDGEGDVVITGNVYGNVLFGTTVLSTGKDPEFPEYGYIMRSYLAKYDAGGQVLWAQLVDHFGALTTDSLGNVLVNGSASLPANFRIPVLWKYEPDGALKWSVDVPEGLTEVAADADGDVLIAGTFSGTQTFGAGGVNETTLTSAGGEDVFVAKLGGADGELLWAHAVGGGGENSIDGLRVDALGRAVVTGRFEGTATLGADEPDETVLNAAGGSDVFVAGYRPDGTLAWATQGGGPADDIPTLLSLDAAGNVVVAGEMGSSATFGPGEAGETTVTVPGEGGVFVARWSEPIPRQLATMAASTEQARGIDAFRQTLLVHLLTRAERRVDTGHGSVACRLLQTYARAAERDAPEAMPLVRAAGSIRDALGCVAVARAR